MDNEGCRDLAAAIVMQAYSDYKHCVKIHKTYPKGSLAYKRAEDEMESIMSFVEGGWYSELTDIPRGKFIAKLKELEK